MTHLRTLAAHLARLLPLAAFLYAPIAYAQVTTVSNSCSGAKDLGSFLQVCVIGFIDSYLVPIIFALAFIVFLWGVYSTFIAGATNEEKRQEGQKLVLYAIIGFFLMFSLWGIVNLLVGTFGFDSATRPNYPTFGKPASTNGTGSTNTPLPSTSGSTGGAGSNHGCAPGYTDTLDGQGCLPDATPTPSKPGTQAGECTSDAQCIPPSICSPEYHICVN